MAKIKNTAKSANVKGQSKYIPSLKKIYRDEIIVMLKYLFKYSNIMEVPKIQFISLNIGLGDAKNNSKGLESALQEISIQDHLSMSSLSIHGLMSMYKNSLKNLLIKVYKLILNLK